MGGVSLKKELQKITSTELTPQTTVNQYGEKNVHIDSVENLNQSLIVLPVMIQASNGTMQMSNKQLNPNCYHLFVLGGESFADGHFVISADRALCSYWTNEDLREKYGRLTADIIEELKTYPALFVPEADAYYGKPSDEQQSFWGLIDDIRVQDNGIKIRFQRILPIPLKDICSIGFELGLKDMTKAITELNRTHWALKNINLIEELRDANISLFGI